MTVPAPRPAPPVTMFGRPVTRAETVTDRQGFLTEGFVPVQCDTCGSGVSVRKNSREHTSIQWNSSASSCEVFAAMRSAGNSPALTPTCPRLMESIDRAAKLGTVDVPGGAP